MNNVINELRNLDLKMQKKVDHLYGDLQKSNDRLEKKIKYNTDEDEAEVPPRLPASQASALKNQSTEERPVSHPYSNRQKAPVELMKSKRTSKEETRSNR